MKRSKNIILLVLSITLAFLSLITVLNYNVVEKNKYQESEVINYLDTDQLTYMYYLIDQMDDNYDFIEIDDSISIDRKEYIKNTIYQEIKYFSYLESDPNITYLIRKDNSTVLSNQPEIIGKDLLKDNNLIYSHVTFPEKGMFCDGDFCNAYQSTNTFNILENLNFEIFYANNKKYLQLGDIQVDLDKIHINSPIGYEIYFLIPNEIVPSGSIFHLLENENAYVLYFFIACILCFLGLFLFFLVTPIKYIEEINPYKRIKHWFLEINLLVFGSLTFLLGTACWLMMHYTINGALLYWLNEISFEISSETLLFFNFVLWCFTYFVLSIFSFLIKYILNSGILSYFRSHTFLGYFFIKIRQWIHDFFSIHVTYKVMIPLIIFLLVNALVLFLGCMSYSFRKYALFYCIGYTGLLFIISIHYIKKTYQQYHILLDKTKGLSEGKFDFQINENLGIFEEYKQELMHVQDGFEKAVQEEVKATSMRTELITNVSHDLKTPITCIKNYVTLLEDENLDEEKRREYVQNLHQYTNRLTRLVEDLFEISKVTSGNVTLNVVELDIVDLMKQILAENEDILAHQELNVITHFSNDHLPVLLDSNKTYRIFENLFINISKYALPHSRVYVDVNDTEEMVVVELKNISKDQMNFTAEEIIERFVRGDSSRHENGSGLGLAIVKSYSELQNIDFQITIDGDLFKTTLSFKKSLK